MTYVWITKISSFPIVEFTSVAYMSHGDDYASSVTEETEKKAVVE
jgi:hypothetical protein